MVVNHSIIAPSKSHSLFTAMKKLFPEQKTIVKYARKTQHPAVFVDMRIGKTLPTIRTIKTYSKKEKEKVLIICPGNAIDDWYNELIGENQYSISILIGSKTERIHKLNEDNQWNIINIDGVRVLQKVLFDYGFNTVVLDESHEIKNNSKRAKLLIKNFRNANHRWALSGTPDPENEMDWFNQLFWCDQNILGFPNWYLWRQKCFKPGFKQWFMKPEYKSTFNKIIADHCLIISRKDIGKEPNWNINKVYCELPERFKYTYQTLQEEFIFEYENEIRKTKHTMTRAVWLRYLASGFNKNILISRHKIDAMLDIIKSIPKDRPVIIWSVYKNEWNAIYKELYTLGNTRLVAGKLSKKEDSEIYEQFKNGKLKFLIANPVKWQTSKNLSAGYGMIYFSLPFSQKVYRQSKDRCVNTMTMQDQNVWILLTKNTIDEHAYDALKSKHLRSSLSKRIIKNMQNEK